MSAFRAGVEATIDFSIAHDDLDVAARFVKWNYFGEFGRFVERSPTCAIERCDLVRAL